MPTLDELHTAAKNAITAVQNAAVAFLQAQANHTTASQTLQAAQAAYDAAVMGGDQGEIAAAAVVLVNAQAALQAASAALDTAQATYDTAVGNAGTARDAWVAEFNRLAGLSS